MKIISLETKGYLQIPLQPQSNPKWPNITYEDYLETK